MPSTSRTIPLGSISAGAAAAVSLDSFREFSRHAVIERAVVQNDSDSQLLIQSQPGQPIVDPGERPEIMVGGRLVILQENSSTAVSANAVRVTIKVTDDCCNV